MKKHIGLPALIICSAVMAPAISEDLLNEWDRGSALAAVNTVDIDAAVLELTDIASLANARHALEQLDRVENRGDWPLPAREAVIYRFARSLANLPAGTVAPEIMQHLKEYQARTLVPHEDHADARVPLFNIRAAAAGVENSWLRQEFAYAAQSSLASRPENLVTEFENASNPQQRRAIIEVLVAARPAEVQAVQDAALGRLADSPVLTPVVAATAARTLDVTAIERLLVDGSGAELPPALVSIGRQLPASTTGGLLAFAIDRAPPVNAAIAIAAWAPGLQHEPGTRDLLIVTLAHPELGASAALALARQPDIQTISILQETAAGDSAAAKRARMALQMNRDGLLGEVNR